MKNILMVTHLYHPSVGGAEFVYQQWAEELVRRGNKVTVLTSDALSTEDYVKCRDNKLPRFEIIRGVRIFRISSNSLLQKLLKYCWLFCNKFGITRHSIGPLFFGPHLVPIPKDIKNTEFDVIIGGPTPTTAPFYAFALARIKKIPFVLFPHFHTEDFLHCATSNRWLLHQSKRIISTTDIEMQFFIQIGISREKIVRINNPVDLKPFGKSVKNNGQLEIPKIFVLYLGQEGRHKNIPLLISAMTSLWKKGESADLVIAGRRTDFSKEIDQLIEDNEYKMKIFRYNNVSDLVKASLLNQCMVLVNPSYHESFGLVFAEAWSQKKAVIGNKIPAVTEVIRDGENGLIFSTNSQVSLEEKISKILADSKLRNTLGQNGYSDVLMLYQIKNQPLEKAISFSVD